MNTKTDSTGAQANWFVGASYGGTDDQMPRFLAEGIWENGYDVPFVQEADSGSIPGFGIELPLKGRRV